MLTKWQKFAFGLAACLPAAAHATLTSQVQLDFAETGFTTAFSTVYNAGDDIQFTENFGGYTLLISADSDNIYGPSALGTNPFLSLTVQVSNVGATPPASPIRIGLSITGITPLAGSLVDFDSQFTGIFHTASSANFHTYFDQTNTLFGRATDLARFDGVSSQSNSDDQSVLETVSDPYSMSIFLTVNPTANAHPTLDGQLTVEAPEPASLVLLGTAVAGLGLTRRRKAVCLIRPFSSPWRTCRLYPQDRRG